MSKLFIHCEKCGKKLIERMPNGLLRFSFGGLPEPPVEMLIAGAVKMRCLRKSCKHWNEVTFFPGGSK